MLTTLLHLSSRLRIGGGDGYIHFYKPLCHFFYFCPEATLGIKKTEKGFKIGIVNSVSYVSREVDSKAKPT